jgi:hypothetical protein
MMPAPRRYSRARMASGPSKAQNWSALAWSVRSSFKVSLSRSPAAAIPPLSVGSLTTTIRARRGYSRARMASGPSRRNWSAGTPSATQSKGLPSQFRVTAILSSWVGQMTTVARARYGYSANNQCSPGYPEAQTVMGRVSRRWLGSTVGSMLRLQRWGSPVSTHCKIPFWGFAKDSRPGYGRPGYSRTERRRPDGRLQ